MPKMMDLITQITTEYSDGKIGLKGITKNCKAHPCL